jgi:23S rRNA pseudouridine1911/1915/1917 synthase
VEENSDYIVLKKPKGLVVHPGVGNESDTLANYIRGYLEAKGEFDESVERGGIVHRLDKGVSGLMVVAKSRESQLLLKDEFENHRVMKVYVAQIEVLQNLPIQREVPDGSVKGDSWYRAEGTVARDPSDRQKMRFRFGDLSSGKKAISNICRLDDDHLAIKIETGRMHQIRATLREMGWGIIGDEKYGKGTGDSIHLESVLLGFNFKGKYREYLL